MTTLAARFDTGPDNAHTRTRQEVAGMPNGVYLMEIHHDERCPAHGTNNTDGCACTVVEVLVSKVTPQDA